MKLVISRAHEKRKKVNVTQDDLVNRKQLQEEKMGELEREREREASAGHRESSSECISRGHSYQRL